VGGGKVADGLFKAFNCGQQLPSSNHGGGGGSTVHYIKEKKQSLSIKGAI
jgi:hypothetical protein